MDSRRRARVTMRCRGARCARPPARPQRQAADAVAAGGRCRRARPRARHGDRGVPDRSGRGPLRRCRPAREVHGVRPPVDDAAGAVSSISTAPRSATPSAPAATRSPFTTRRADRGQSRRAGDGRAVPHDREPARAGARQDGARRCRRRRRRAAGDQRPAHRTRSRPSPPNCARWPGETTSTSTRRRSSGSCSSRSAAQPAGSRRPRPAIPPTPQTLEKLKDQWPEFIEPLLRHREVEKLRGTYGEGLLHEVADDGRIHATFNQTVARTGRLSSDQPNLHNIPVRTDEGRVFRTAFVPAPARRCWSPTTTRSSCAASPTSRRTRA